MLHNRMSRIEIIEELEKHGDFVKIDYLEDFLNQSHPTEMKKFLYLQLAKLYEKMKMLGEAAKVYDKIAVISIAFTEKIKNHLKEAELYVRAGRFEGVDAAMKKAMNQANASEKQDIFFTIRNFYKRQAELYEQVGKINHAAMVYERLIEMQISESEREDINKKLGKLYEKLGKSGRSLF